MLTLPKTLAHLHDDALTQAMNEELTAERLPLENYLTHGGWPGSSKITVRGIKEDVTHATVLMTVEFIEEVPAACPASSRPETRIAYLAAKINKADASAEIVED
jgi:hypothetical protein